MVDIDLLGYTGAGMLCVQNAPLVIELMREGDTKYLGLQSKLFVFNLVGASLFLAWGIVTNNKVIYTTTPLLMAANIVCLAYVFLFHLVKKGRLQMSDIPNIAL